MFSPTTSPTTPLDIPCAKLVDWLVQRRYCKRDWGENLASIRRKIKSAIKDMPESEEIRQLLVGSKLDYFKSKQIVDILKTTEADSKNIFGFYSSQRMKDWQDIVQCYERDYVYLAEIATDLIREVNYEVPGLQRLTQRLHKEKAGAEKDKANLLRRAQQFNSEYQKLAQTYGIRGVDVVNELQDQTKNLNNVMDELVDLSKGLITGSKYYKEYTKSTTKSDSSLFLPVLNHVIENGNTTVYQLRYNQIPESIELDEKPAASSSSGDNQSEIELVTDEIDFGDDVPSSSESSSGFVHVGEKNDNTLVNPGQAESNKVARGDEALSVLQLRKTRNQYLNNIFELEAFFKQFISEDQTESTNKLDKKEVEAILSTIKKITDIINKEKNKVLFQMSDCPSFIDNLNDKFILKTKQASDSRDKAEEAQDRIRQIEEQIKETDVLVKKNIVIAKHMQSTVQNSISKLCARPINIMGCV